MNLLFVYAVICLFAGIVVGAVSSLDDDDDDDHGTLQPIYVRDNY